MKHFVAVFLGSPTSMEAWNALDEATRAARMKEGAAAWGKWMEDHQSAVVFNGGPLGKTKRVSANGVSDAKNLLTAYVVVQADSHEAAAKMFLRHPHFMIFPGDGIEVMEALPIPKIEA